MTLILLTPLNPRGVVWDELTRNRSFDYILRGSDPCATKDGFVASAKSR
jgi:hypothetical protein